MRIKFLLHKIRNTFRRSIYNEPFSPDYYYYYEKINSYRSVDPYMNLYERCCDEDNLKTENEICFSSKIKFGSPLRAIKRIVCHKHFPIHSKLPLNINILFYKIFLGKYKVRLEMHFFKRKLFFFSYIFKDLSDDEKREIVRILHKKYLLRCYESFNMNIVDSQNNCIKIDNNIYFTINYLSLNSDFFKYAMEIKEKEKKKQLKKAMMAYNDIMQKL